MQPAIHTILVEEMPAGDQGPERSKEHEQQATRCEVWNTGRTARYVCRAARLFQPRASPESKLEACGNAPRHVARKTDTCIRNGSDKASGGTGIPPTLDRPRVQFWASDPRGMPHAMDFKKFPNIYGFPDGEPIRVLGVESRPPATEEKQREQMPPSGPSKEVHPVPPF